VELFDTFMLEYSLLRGRLDGRPLFAERFADALALDVMHRVARDLEQPAGEAALAAEAADLRERIRERVARDVLTGRPIAGEVTVIQGQERVWVGARPPPAQRPGLPPGHVSRALRRAPSSP